MTPKRPHIAKKHWQSERNKEQLDNQWCVSDEIDVASCNALKHWDFLKPQEGEQEGKHEAGDAGYNSQPKRGDRPTKD